MHFSRLVDCALRLTMDLATVSAAPIREIAQRQEVSMAYIGKLSQILTRAGLVAGTRGRRGHLRLTRPPQGITLLDLVEAVEGPLRTDRCLLSPNGCPRQSSCRAFCIFADIQETARARLAATTIADLCQPVAAA